LFRGISLQLLRQVIVNLVEERVPLSTHREDLMNELQQLVVEVRDVEVLTQKLREHVAVSLCRTFLDESSRLAVLTLDPVFEDSLASLISSQDSGRFLRLNSERALALASEVRAYLELNHENDVHPVLVCIPTLRLPLSSMLRRFDPRISVLSFSELPRDIAVTHAGLLKDRWAEKPSVQRGGAGA
jgi:flagellar biosynthesis protein FlhA